MFQGLSRSFNGGKINFEIFIKDLPRDKLTARSDFWECAKVRTVRVAEMAFFAIFSYHSVKIKKSSLDLTLST